MKLSSKCTVLVGIFASAVVGVAQASDGAMLDACIRQFIASEFSDYSGKISIRKDSARANSFPLPAQVHEVAVSAADAKGVPLASATCKVESDGTVMSITPHASAAKIAKTATPLRVAKTTK
jgi:hypothetical protein